VNAATGGWFPGATVTVCEILFVAPWLSLTVSVTVNVPPAVYVCDGFCVVRSRRPEGPGVARD